MLASLTSTGGSVIGDDVLLHPYTRSFEEFPGLLPLHGFLTSADGSILSDDVSNSSDDGSDEINGGGNGSGSKRRMPKVEHSGVRCPLHQRSDGTRSLTKQSNIRPSQYLLVYLPKSTHGLHRSLMLPAAYTSMEAMVPGRGLESLELTLRPSNGTGYMQM